MIIDAEGTIVDEGKEPEKETFIDKAKKAASDVKDAVCDTARDIRDWCVNNKEAAVILIPVVAKCTFSAIRQVRRAHQNKEAEELKTLYVYDRSLGRYWRLRRPMSVSEQLEFERRKRAGEPIGEILGSMRLL